jgi:hypothetical protein
MVGDKGDEAVKNTESGRQTGSSKNARKGAGGVVKPGLPKSPGSEGWLWTIIDRAVAAVPPVRFAVGLLGLIAVAALGMKILGGDIYDVVRAILIILGLSTLLVVFTRLARERSRSWEMRLAAGVLLLLAIGGAGLSLSSFFFGLPLKWKPGRVDVAKKPAPDPHIARIQAQLLLPSGRCQRPVFRRTKIDGESTLRVRCECADTKLTEEIVVASYRGEEIPSIDIVMPKIESIAEKCVR